MTGTGVCPLCGGPLGATTALAATTYRGTEYRFRRCRQCRSAACDPMPDDRALATMYGIDYFDEPDGEPDERDLTTPLRFLETLAPGTFIDFGCGSAGGLLAQAQALGWEAIGVEFDASVARAAAAASGARVITIDEAAGLPEGTATLLNLSDVVEHLRTPLDEVASALRLLAVGGTCTAQGPLEGERTLFGLVLEAWMRWRPVGTIPPHHVTLATARGQRELFRRVALEEVELRVTEVAWPAPARWSSAQGRRGRGLWALRRASRLLTRLMRPVATWGNRYDYVGRRAA